jgi:hypothetical protein
MSKNEAAGDPDCTEVLEEGSRSILLSLASQLRKGMDLVSELKHTRIIHILLRNQYLFPLDQPLTITHSQIASSHFANFRPRTSQYAGKNHRFFLSPRLYTRVS